MLGPLDVFTHGYYCNEIDVDQIDDIDWIGQIEVNAADSKIVFSPDKSHFAGIEIFLVGFSQENGGNMTVTITDSDGVLVDETTVDLSKVNESSWYKVYTDGDYSMDEQYTIRFDVSDSTSVPSFQMVNPDYLGDETIEGNILISYAYSQSTFSLQEKILLSVLLLLCLGIELSFFVPNDIYLKKIRYCIFVLTLTFGMTWNYMYNTFNDRNTEFNDFEDNSETLVISTILAQRDGIHFLDDNEVDYGLGRYVDLKGYWFEYGLSYVTDDDWLEGYSKTIPAIKVNSNIATESIAVEGNHIRFKNGEEYEIIKVDNDGTDIVIYLDADRLLSEARNGSLDDTQFYDSDHLPLAKTFFYRYISQFGCQGIVFRHIAKYMNENEVLPNLNLLCSFATAIVFVLIVVLLSKKYNGLYAGCFYIVFFLSPWVVNFARNLYWVEFTWFVPMLIGLICSLKIEEKKWRLGCYAAALISIFCKCICGYEYITLVMLGLISFTTVDLVLAIIAKDKSKAKKLFKTTFVLGILALVGFMCAILIHAVLKGYGDVAYGVQRIISEDVLRRTNGADLNEFSAAFWPSMNASVWEVFCTYFHMSTEIISGVPGVLFPIMCVVPVVIFVYEACKKKTDYSCVVMYVFFFLQSISWICLAKSHSYVHTWINYIAWYFGFVQLCFYVIVSRIYAFVSAGKSRQDGT